MSIYYHGTTKEKADTILKEGFNKGTYFTWDLHSALVMGGIYVFGISFDDKDHTDYWEWITPDPIDKEKILYLRKFEVTCLYDNQEEDERIKHLNQVEYHGRPLLFCNKCKGRGQLNTVPKYGGWSKEPCVVCPDCNGHGAVEIDGTQIN